MSAERRLKSMRIAEQKAVAVLTLRTQRAAASRRIRTMEPEDKFHAHLDECRQCREEIFNLCPTGAKLLEACASCDSMFRGLMQWNKVLNREAKP